MVGGAGLDASCIGFTVTDPGSAGLLGPTPAVLSFVPIGVVLPRAD